jgi:hypothetical protein
MAVIFVGVGGSSSFTYRHAGTSVAMRTRSAGDMRTPVVTGSSWTTTGMPIASATAR